MTDTHTIPALDLAGVSELARLVAFFVKQGDLIALGGDLGAGKTTLARALIEAVTGDDEVPSPTFTLVQTYASPRMAIAHYDLYRLRDPAELVELGLEEALDQGIALVEWPENAGDALPPVVLEIRLREGSPEPGDARPPEVLANLRDVTLVAQGDWAGRLQRLLAIRTFLALAAPRAGRLRYLQGDASVRRYATLEPAGPSRSAAILMDWPQQPDGPVIRNGLPYSRIAHLAEGVRPFVAIADGLRAAGLCTPEILAHDLDQGLLLIGHLGDRVFAAECLRHANQAQLWQAAVNVLLILRGSPPPDTLPLPDGTAHRLPRYDRPALGIETELLVDWYWPLVHGAPIPEAVRAEFLALWDTVIERLLERPTGWVLRDYHSPNLLWRPTEAAPRNVGLIDFQDALRGPLEYDLVSLLQDARVDVVPELERSLFEHYCRQVVAIEPGFDRDAFTFAYAALGLQRNTKILGIFARLAKRDGKPQYLAHMPRIWGYVERNLEHPDLRPLKAWCDRHFPVAARR